MKLDFWNNPIVVSAFRVKYRRGSPAVFASLYLAVLIAIGMLLHLGSKQVAAGLVAPSFQPHPLTDWIRIYFVVVLGIQSVLSIVIALSATSTSINQEVVNRTLDFQRIVSLGPREILVGKLLGEPALAYLLAIATVPISVWCAIFADIPLPQVALMYASLLTTTVLAGSLGLLHSLKPPSQQSAVGGMGCLVIIFLFFVLPTLIINSVAMLSNPWVAAGLGLFTPAVGMIGIFRETPWAYGLPLFGVEIPYLWVTPVSQLAIAALFVQAMTRRLVDPDAPALSKPMAYLVLIAVDVVAGGIAFDGSGVGLFARTPIGAVCLVHLIASVLLTFGMTPGRTALQSWLWRFRRRSSKARSLLLDARTPNSGALVGFCAIGLIGVTAIMTKLATSGGVDDVTALVYTDGFDAARSLAPFAARTVGTTVLLVLAFGALYQACVVVAGRGAVIGCLLFFILLNIVPFAAGEYWESELMRSLSAGYQVGRWFIMADSGLALPLMPLPEFPPLALLLAVYGAILAFSLLWTYRWIAASTAIIDRKLETMGVGAASEIRSSQVQEGAAPAEG